MASLHHNSESSAEVSPPKFRFSADKNWLTLGHAQAPSSPPPAASSSQSQVNHVVLRFLSLIPPDNNSPPASSLRAKLEDPTLQRAILLPGDVSSLARAIEENKFDSSPPPLVDAFSCNQVRSEPGYDLGGMSMGLYDFAGPMNTLKAYITSFEQPDHEAFEELRGEASEDDTADSAARPPGTQPYA